MERAAERLDQSSAGTPQSADLSRYVTDLAADHNAPVKAAPSTDHWYNSALTIGEDLAKGAWHEAKDHPLHLVESFAVGVGAAAAVTAVATVVGPEAVTVATIGGLAYGAYQVGEHASSWYHSVKDVIHPEQHSAAEVAQAHQTIQNFGAGATDLAAGIAGGVAYKLAAPAIASALRGGAAAEANPAEVSDDPVGNNTSDTPNNKADIGDHHVKAATGATGATNANGNTTGDGGSTHASAVHAHHAITAGAVGGDPTPEDAVGAEVAKAPPIEVEATPQQMAMAESVKNSQGIFNAANSSDSGAGVVESSKQLYNVRFEKVTEDAGRRIFTLENRTEGVLVPKGAYLATRLTDAGVPDVEEGMVNNWSIEAPKIAKTYVVDPKTLTSSDNFVAPTNVDAPPVHMVQLEKPATITTAWGEMKGKIGDWLANYDYDKAAGQPGHDYAIVTNRSYGQTYQATTKS